MGHMVLVTGGSRSGKSSYAQKAVEALKVSRLYVATCPVIDEEMERRIRMHQQERNGRGWNTVEEPVHLAQVLDGAHAYASVLVDCLTLWVNNLMYAAEAKEQSISESDIARECGKVTAACMRHPGTVYFVTNEVGMGIIPENASARLYRDLVGRCNQIIAGACHQVVLLVSGQPVIIKNEAADPCPQ